MSFRSFAQLLVAVAAVAIAIPGMAQPAQSFSMAALKAAQARGQPVLIDAFAPWCPTCRAQAPTIEALATDPAYKNLQIMRLDYDNQIEAKKALGIRKQSTLIAYNGTREVGRSVGVTDAQQIRQLAALTLK